MTYSSFHHPSTILFVGALQDELGTNYDVNASVIEKLIGRTQSQKRRDVEVDAIHNDPLDEDGSVSCLFDESCLLNHRVSSLL